MRNICWGIQICDFYSNKFQRCWDTSHKVKYTNIIQEWPRWPLELKNIKSQQKKPNKIWKKQSNWENIFYYWVLGLLLCIVKYFAMGWKTTPKMRHIYNIHLLLNGSLELKIIKSFCKIYKIFILLYS